MIKRIIGYLLDEDKKLYIPGFHVPTFDYIINVLKSENIFIIDKCKMISDEIDRILKGLHSVNSKGFVNSKDLYDYPYISEYFQYILDLEKAIDPKTRKADFKHLSTLLSTKDKMFVYKWVYNLINLKLYTIIEYLLYEIDDIKDKIDDPIYFIYKDLRNIVYNNLDPAVRRHLTRRGISIINNIYTGFDTEYDNIDEKTNKLLSVQLATTFKILLKLPLRTEFNYEELNIGDNSYYNYEGSSDLENTFEFDENREKAKLEANESKSKDNKGVKTSEEMVTGYVNKEGIKEDINSSIFYLRALKYKTYDYVFDKIIKGLKRRGFDFIEKDDDIYFIFGKDKLIKE